MIHLFFYPKMKTIYMNSLLSHVIACMVALIDCVLVYYFVFLMTVFFLFKQELRKLVRRVHAVQDRKNVLEENEQEAALVAAKKTLMRFLRTIAKQMPTESIHNGL